MELVNFLRDYWQYIGAAILVLLDVIIMIIKKRPSSKDDLLDATKKLLLFLPHIITMAEEKGGTGIEKKNYVLEYSLTYVEEILGRDIKPVEFKKWYEVVSAYIEDLLEVPTKKGGYGREKDE